MNDLEFFWDFFLTMSSILTTTTKFPDCPLRLYEEFSPFDTLL
jgi:hypothetical protein